MTNITTTPRNLAPTRGQKFRTRVLPFIIAAIVLALLPAFGPSRTTYSLLNMIGINVVFSLSYNMLLGQGGLLSFGHAVYFGLGGYAAMHGMNWIENASYDGGIWAGFPVFGLPLLGFAGGALAGAVLGWPSCRRSGVPFAMISLGIAELVAAAGFMFVSVFGGEEGISGDRMNGIELFGLSLGPVSDVYIFIAFWTLLAALLMFGFTRTPLGKLVQASRDNPQRVQFVGYDTQKIRYLAFVFSGGFAGLAGGMAAVNFEILTPETLSTIPSGMVLLMAYIGGIRSFAGPILGAAVLTYAQSNLSDYTEGWLLYLGLGFIILVLFAPNGLAGMVQGFVQGMRQTGRGARLLRWLGLSALWGLLALGVIVLVELALRWSNAQGETLDMFGVILAPGAPLAWALGLVLVGLGLAGMYFMREKGGRP